MSERMTIEAALEAAELRLKLDRLNRQYLWLEEWVGRRMADMCQDFGSEAETQAEMASRADDMERDWHGAGAGVIARDGYAEIMGMEPDKARAALEAAP